MFAVPINYFAVIVGAAINMALGFLWYGPLFANAWLAEIGKKREELGNPGPGYAAVLVGALVASFVLQLFVKAHEVSLANGLLTGLLVGIGFVATTFGGNYIFGGKSLRLYLIDAGYHVVSLTIVGAMMGIWP